MTLFTALVSCSLQMHVPLFSSPAQTFASHAVQEIRQLNMKQEGFVREISDLQETVEWKDKKIGVRLLSPRCWVLFFFSTVPFLLCMTLTFTLHTLHV